MADSSSMPERIVDDPRITESSGLVRDTRRPGTWWTHNDSGDVARLFQIGPDDAARAFPLSDASAIDWEDATTVRLDDGSPGIAVVDTGNNQRRRDAVAIHLIRPGDDRVTLEGTVRFRFDDGPHDCEAVASHRDGRSILLFTKSWTGGCGVYELNLPDPAEGSVTTANRLGWIAFPLATAADHHPRHGWLLTNYRFAAIYTPRPNDRDVMDTLRRQPRLVRLPPLAQIEAAAWNDDGTFTVTSEGSPMPMVRVEPDGPVTATPTEPPSND